MPDSMTDCLNFGNPENPEHLYDFEEVVRGMGDVARALKIPFPSGNVSFYNESQISVVPPTAVVLGCGIVNDIRKCVTSDMKCAGDLLYMVGETGAQMGGCEYYALNGGVSPKAPPVDSDQLKKSVDAMVKGIEKGLLMASHDIGTGGLAVTVAEMCMGGDLGAAVDLAAMGALKGAKLGRAERLFSESNGRWVVEVDPKKQKAFEEHMNKASVPVFMLGKAGGKELVLNDGKNRVATLKVDVMREAWSTAFSKMLG
jgi:phosphoribosylformylglycinamidine synthase